MPIPYEIGHLASTYNNAKYNIQFKEHQYVYCIFNVVDEEGNIVKNSESVNIRHISLDVEL